MLFCVVGYALARWCSPEGIAEIYSRNGYILYKYVCESFPEFYASCFVSGKAFTTLLRDSTGLNEKNSKLQYPACPDRLPALTAG